MGRMWTTPFWPSLKTLPFHQSTGAEEASEGLLCALSEMLDRVGQDDDGGIFSPFDVLPNTELRHQAEQTDEPPLQVGRSHITAGAALGISQRVHTQQEKAEEPSPSPRLRPRPKRPTPTFRSRSGGEQKVERNAPPQTLKKQNQTLFSSKTRRAKSEVEVFTSTSLVSLVKLMHPYCLKLHVEKEDGSLFSQEEVWRYERPSEGSDEEINVVSDDEALSKTKEEEAAVGGIPGSGPLLKSVLLNGKPSREKKRVSFGPVHVASFDKLEEDDFKEKNLSISEGTTRLDDPAASSVQPPMPPSGGKQGVAEEEPAEKKKGGTKTKSLSLQEYRQLRLNRRPPLEKRRNYTTKWPSVSELPKELTPILPFCRPNTAAEGGTVIQRTKHQHHDGLKSSKPEPRISSTSPLLDHTCVRKTPVKKPKLLSSDPPNPVLVPLPAPHTPSDCVRVHSSKHLQKLQNESSAAPHPGSSEQNPPNRDFKVVETPIDEAEMSPPVPLRSPQEKRAEAAEESSCPSSTAPIIQPQAPTQPHTMLKEEIADAEEEEPHQGDCRESGAAVGSGIEAADLTSLLEQFEETQATEDGVCNDEPKPVRSASSSFTEASCRVELDRREAAASQQTSLSPLMSPVEPRKPLSTEESLSHVRTLDVPEPLRTEVVLSSQQNRPLRPRSLSLKPIQIIDPRPLPSRKLRTGQSEPSAAQSSARIYSHLCSDHDYCGSADRRPPQTKQASEASLEPEPMGQESEAAGGDGVSENQPSDPTWTSSESESSAEEALPVPPRASTEGGGDRTAVCGLPTPPPTPPVRGRSKRRYRRRSPRSDSSSGSSSCSCSPKRPRIRHRRSESSSCSSSASSCDSPPRHYRTSYSRSRSWSRSPSPQIYHRGWRDVSSSRESRRHSREQEMRIQKLKAIDERRVVYVGRIRRTMTHDELRERFSQFGQVECVSLHFRDGSDHYGFVTFYNAEDAFAAIDNGGKLRKADELPFDLCFGGRRQFCNSDYADLDANKEADPSPPRSRFEDLDFDLLLKQAQRGLKR